MATLIGVARTLPETCTFGVPVFVDGQGREVAQRIDESGIVINFELMETPTEFRPVLSQIEVRPGDSALFAFEIAAETFLVGTGRELAAALRREATATVALRDATRRAVQRFIDSTLSKSAARSGGTLFQFSSRDPSMQSASRRRHNLAESSLIDWMVAASLAAFVAFLSLGRPKLSGENTDQTAVTILQPKVKVEPPDIVVSSADNELRKERLSDGSSVLLSPGTRMQYNLSGMRRTVQLSRGRARFNVAKDPARPFTVSTPMFDVTAVGTQFSVAIDTDVAVEVYEGIVQVSVHGGGLSRTFKAGQSLRLHR